MAVVPSVAEGRLALFRADFERGFWSVARREWPCREMARFFRAVPADVSRNSFHRWPDRAGQLRIGAQGKEIGGCAGRPSIVRPGRRSPWSSEPPTIRCRSPRRGWPVKSTGSCGQAPVWEALPGEAVDPLDLGRLRHRDRAAGKNQEGGLRSLRRCRGAPVHAACSWLKRGCGHPRVQPDVAAQFESIGDMVEGSAAIRAARDSVRTSSIPPRVRAREGSSNSRSSPRPQRAAAGIGVPIPCPADAGRGLDRQHRKASIAQALDQMETGEARADDHGVIELRLPDHLAHVSTKRLSRRPAGAAPRVAPRGPRRRCAARRRGFSRWRSSNLTSLPIIHGSGFSTPRLERLPAMDHHRPAAARRYGASCGSPDPRGRRRT